MKKTLICISAMLITAAMGWSQGRGAGAGGGRSAAPSMPTQSGMPAQAGAHDSHGAPAKPTASQPAVKTQAKTEWATRLGSNTQLSQRLQPMLPTGMTLDAAAAGFKNQGQFIAALQVSKNLGIPFADLKAAMTSPDGLSLGKSIQQLRPEIKQPEVDEAVKTAERQAKELGKIK